MKALIQRVKQANVKVDGHSVGAIEQGILAYIGVGHDDNQQSMQRLVNKILTYRIFENTAGKLDKNVQEVEGGLLLVSQFTLQAKTDKGRRPDFGPAMTPDAAQALFAELSAYARTSYSKVAFGQFGANMQVLANNDGPINFILEVN